MSKDGLVISRYINANIVQIIVEDPNIFASARPEKELQGQLCLRALLCCNVFTLSAPEDEGPIISRIGCSLY